MYSSNQKPTEFRMKKQKEVVMEIETRSMEWALVSKDQSLD